METKELHKCLDMVDSISNELIEEFCKENKLRDGAFDTGDIPGCNHKGLHIDWSCSDESMFEDLESLFGNLGEILKLMKMFSEVRSL
tara:strand:- start:300 stop:560 length:261 start_codon:yes stop_codon:yes gene_type:complete